MNRASDSRRLMNRSYRRIKRLGARELTTTDPAALEVAIAQIDALLGLAAAIQEGTVEMSLLRRQVAYGTGTRTLKFEDVTEQQQIDRLKMEVKTLREAHKVVLDEVRAAKQAAAQHGVESGDPTVPWWKFWQHP